MNVYVLSKIATICQSPCAFENPLSPHPRCAAFASSEITMLQRYVWAVAHPKYCHHPDMPKTK